MKIGNRKSKITHKYTNSLRFHLERLLLRGAGYRLLVIAVLIGLVTVLGGLLALYAAGGFAGPGEALWWAFLRLTDPGYLGDDQGMFLRSISSVLTVLGYVLFMGSLIAILTQWLNQTIQRLEQGLTPICKKNHVLILGWTNQTPLIVRELVLSRERVNRFLRRHGVRDLSLVILCESLSTEHRLELKHHLGSEWNEGQIVFRSGSPLRLEHLQRVDFLRAAVIILPGSDFVNNGAELMDARTVKTLLSISRAEPDCTPEQLPLLTAEMNDIRKVPLACSAYGGRAEIVGGDALISRLLIQNIRHPWMSLVSHELLSHGTGNEIFLKDFPELAGTCFEKLELRFPEAIALGVLRKQEEGLLPLLNPAADLRLEASDRLVFLSRSYTSIIPTTPDRPGLAPGKRQERVLQTKKNRHILFLGWNDRMPQLIHELDQFEAETFHLDILSRVPATERISQIARYRTDLKRVSLVHLEGDYLTPNDVSDLNLMDFGTIVMPGSDRLDTKETADARTLMGLYLVQEMLGTKIPRPKLLVELFDPDNLHLIQDAGVEVLVSPVILSHILAHVALRPELNLVFSELFGSGGAEIFFKPSSDYGFGGQDILFGQIQQTVSGQGEIALGLCMGSSRAGSKPTVHLNPARETRWSLGDQDAVVVLTSLP